VQSRQVDTWECDVGRGVDERRLIGTSMNAAMTGGRVERIQG